MRRERSAATGQPFVVGTIARRILVNYRVDPEIAARQLPEPFRPQLVDGAAIAGICLIRLERLRPRGLPAMLGLSSENAAYRIAVEWPVRDGVRRGVYVWHRDTSSPLNACVGGPLALGVHHRAQFRVADRGDVVAFEVDGADGSRLELNGRLALRLSRGSVFGSIDRASEFFRAGSRGYSPGKCPGELHGVELRCHSWSTYPFELARVRASFFDDFERFPRGSIQLDSALLMRGIEHEWRVLREPDYLARSA